MFRKSTAFFILFFCSFSSLAAAGVSFPASPWVSKQTYAEKTAGKLGFGFLNFSTGWTALIFRISRENNKLKGFGKGVGYALSNTAGGALHAVTFPIPLDVPLPDGGISHEYE